MRWVVDGGAVVVASAIAAVAAIHRGGETVADTNVCQRGFAGSVVGWSFTSRAEY